MCEATIRDHILDSSPMLEVYGWQCQSARRRVHHFGPDCSAIHAAHEINPNDFGDPLIFPRVVDICVFSGKCRKTTIGWIAMTFGKDTYIPLMTNWNNFGDPP